MNTKKKLSLSLIGILVLLALIVSISNFTVSEKKKKDTADKNSQLEQEAMELDYSNIDTVVSEVLKEELSVAKEIEEIRKVSADAGSFGDLEKDRSVQDAFDVQKTNFRQKVENQLLDQAGYDNETLLANAKKHNDNYLNTLETAEKDYGVTVSQEEVTKYIDQNVAGVQTEEKEKYAKALGLTMQELDHVFDRDFYVMDTLWEKLIPVLMETYPQQDDEDQNDYFKRIKNEFYKKS